MNNMHAISHNDMKKRNRGLVLKLICTGKANTRMALTELAGLSKMTVTNIVNELIEEKYLCIDGQVDEVATQGRKANVLKVSPEAPLVAGIYVERNECAVVVSSIDARIMRREQMPLWQGIRGDELLETLLLKLRAMTKDLPNSILGIGIASIGPIDRRNGIILNPPDFYGLQNIPIVEFFAQRTGLPVLFDNSMNAAVLAERVFGNAKEIDNIAYVGVLRGVGAGIISGGNLLRSTSGVNGEIGHSTINYDGLLCQCGNRGCLELYTSLPVIVEKANQEIAASGHAEEYGVLNWPTLVAKAREGDYYCQRALKDLCEFLSLGIANLINMFDSDYVFLGHDIALAEGLIEQTLEEKINRRIFARGMKTVKVSMSAFGEQAPLIGSICLILHNMLFQP